MWPMKRFTFAIVLVFSALIFASMSVSADEPEYGFNSTQTRSAAVAVLDELQVALHAVHGRHLSAFPLQCVPDPLGVARWCSRFWNVAVLARSKLHFTCNWNWWTRGLPSKFWN